MKTYFLLLGAIAASMATFVATVTWLDPSPTPADPFFGLHLSAPEIADDDPRLAPVVSYRSDSLHYALTYPSTWSLDDTKERFDGDILTTANEEVVMTISTLNTQDSADAIAEGMRSVLMADQSLNITTFSTLTWKDFDTIYTEGVHTIVDTQYTTRSYAIIRPERGDMLSLSITTVSEADLQFETQLQAILDSLSV